VVVGREPGLHATYPIHSLLTGFSHSVGGLVVGRNSFAARLRAGAIAVLVVSAMLAAGAASAGGSASAVTVSVRLSAAGVAVSVPAVPTGEVRFQVRNLTGVARQFGVVGKRRTGLIEPRGSASLTVRFTRPGTRQLLSAAPRAGRAPVLHGSLRIVMPARTTLTVPPVRLTQVAKGLASATDVVAPPGDTSRVLVVQQNGIVSLLVDGVLQPRPFLDLRNVVVADGEKGLLSIAFAPDYATSGLVYAYFNNRDGNIRVREYHRSATDPEVIDTAQRRLLLALVKPTADHNGGMMQFGPDGYLYLSIGDGGANPPTIPVGVTGQTLNDLFGSILRIDPRSGDPYAIPAGNPFTGVEGARAEIVAYGLRNPWRFSIDAKTDEMLIGDVGEGSREEIDRLPLTRLGANFGWPCKEGNVIPPGVTLPAGCKTATLTPPLWQYPHSDTRCSVIGGSVARDPRLPALDGVYVWSDFCDGEIYALDPASAEPAEIPLGIRVSQPTSFGTDGLGRIYVTTTAGSVYRIDPT
jgi:glucose/arabinose dehydrogenase